MLTDININDIKNIALEAGIAIMEIYKYDFDVEYKEDMSPLTQADLKANTIICTNLEKLYPRIPILSEENLQIPFETRKNWSYYWCIDPLDGTKEFIKKNDEFTVNIALICKNEPVLGVVYAPAVNKMYYAKKGEGAFLESYNSQIQVFNKQKLPLTKNNTNILQIMVSKSHLSEETNDYIEQLFSIGKHIKKISKGSSLKLCLVATGEADMYPRLSPTMEWDTAAADAIVREVGKMTFQYDKNIFLSCYLVEEGIKSSPILYNKENLLNPWFIVV